MKYASDENIRIAGRLVAILAEEKVTFKDANDIFEICRIMVEDTAVVTAPAAATPKQRTTESEPK